jgi:predicted TIM-barrel fold metal-dependent hydrolase
VTNFAHSEVERWGLLDANCRLGPSNLTTERAPSSIGQLRAEMDRCGIAEALVYHSLAAAYEPSFGNERLLEEIAEFPGLYACWVLIPGESSAFRGSLHPFSEILQSKLQAVRVFPKRHRVSLSSWSADGLLQELAAHNVPLFLDFDRAHWADDPVDYDQVSRICETFPALPVVLVREGIGSTRYLYPLLERFDNLHIEISYYQASGGLEEITRRFGAGHLLFGTGLPDYSAGPAISMLLLSGLSQEEKRLIGGDNLRKLLRAVG